MPICHNSSSPNERGSLRAWVRASMRDRGLYPAVLGPERFRTHLRVARDEAVRAWEVGLSDEELEAHVHQQIRDLEQQGRTCHVKVGQVADRLVAAKAADRAFERDLADRRKRLSHFHGVLENDKPTYEIAG
jgi:hypothetical protein